VLIDIEEKIKEVELFVKKYQIENDTSR